MSVISPGVKFSNFTNQGTLQPGDEIVGLRNGKDARFDAPVASTVTSLTRNIVQAGHGLLVGNVVGFYVLSGVNYVKSQANNSLNANVVGIVTAIIDANTFTLLFGGYITTLSNVTGGLVYFLDPTTPGRITPLAPNTPGQIRKPLLMADSTTSGYWLNYNGQQL